MNLPNPHRLSRSAGRGAAAAGRGGARAARGGRTTGRASWSREQRSYSWWARQIQGLCQDQNSRHLDTNKGYDTGGTRSSKQKLAMLPRQKLPASSTHPCWRSSYSLWPPKAVAPFTNVWRRWDRLPGAGQLRWVRDTTRFCLRSKHAACASRRRLKPAGYPRARAVALGMRATSPSRQETLAMRVSRVFLLAKLGQDL